MTAVPDADGLFSVGAFAWLSFPTTNKRASEHSLFEDILAISITMDDGHSFSPTVRRSDSLYRQNAHGWCYKFER
jgi:hypothetical protein